MLALGSSRCSNPGLVGRRTRSVGWRVLLLRQHDTRTNSKPPSSAKEYYENACKKRDAKKKTKVQSQSALDAHITYWGKFTAMTS
eukprot:881497-Amphidinium_carterae.1